MNLKYKGISSSYMNCVYVLKSLKIEWFGSDIEQYNLIPSYMVDLNDRGHERKLEIVDDEYVRLCAIFRGGIQDYKLYREHVVAVDGTFRKTSIGGVLLVAWLCNGNNGIEIVGVGIISVENEDDWSWFLHFLISHLQSNPAFVILDRNKGLMNAVQKLYKTSLTFLLSASNGEF